jgi:hypothetical protein
MIWLKFNWFKKTTTSFWFIRVIWLSCNLNLRLNDRLDWVQNYESWVHKRVIKLWYKYIVNIR